MRPEAVYRTSCRTLAEADAAIRRFYHDVYIEVMESSVRYDPDESNTLLEQGQFPYKVTVHWTVADV